MDATQIEQAARNAIDRTRAHYGPKVWDYVNGATRKGWVAWSIVVDFAAFAPDTPARDIAAVVKAAHEIMGGED